MSIVYVAKCESYFQPDGYNYETLGVASSEEVAEKIIAEDVAKFKEKNPNLADDFETDHDYYSANNYGQEWAEWFVDEYEVRDE